MDLHLKPISKDGIPEAISKAELYRNLNEPGEAESLLESGDTLLVIESMKMEIPVITEDAGTVKEILVKEKDPVAEGQVVAVLDG